MKKCCSKCKIRKEGSQFTKRASSKDGLTGQCTSCLREIKNKYDTSDRRKITSKTWKKTNKVKIKSWYLKNKYNITHEEYLSLLKSQDNKCKCCNKTSTLCVDHDHSTNKVRGLLCSNCNRALGLINDNIDTLKYMITYLSITNKFKE